MADRAVPRDLVGSPLDAVVRTLFETTWGQARRWIAGGKIRVDGAVWTDERRPVGAGSSLALDVRAPRPRPDELATGAVVHADAHVVVVDKPTGVSTVPYDDPDEDTLDARVRNYLARRVVRKGSGAQVPLGVVHRLDKETTGLIVFTRTWLAKQRLAAQFRQHTVERRYVAIVHGHLRPRTFRSWLVPDRGDGLRGSSPQAGHGQEAITHVTVLERLEGATLVSCRLETGRTHQIRIHLSEAGHPLVGERVYIRGFRGEELRAPRMMLHAQVLGFVHPKTEQDVRWERDPPADFVETCDRLGR